MPDTLHVQLSELAGYASSNAHLGPPAALRVRGTRRTRRRGAVLCLAGVVAAAGIAAGVGQAVGSSPAAVSAHAPAQAPAPAGAPAFPGSVRLTAYQARTLAAAKVTRAQLAAVAKARFTPVQIQALATQLLAHEGQPAGGASAPPGAKVAAGYLFGLPPGQRDALVRQGLTVRQLAAIAKAHLSAAQLSALAGS